MAKTISAYDVLVNFVSLITFMLDVGTDILVTVQFFENDDIVWGSLAAGFVVVPTLIIQIFSLKWHITDKTMSVLTCLPHLFLFAPIQRYLRVIRLGLKARATRSFYDVDRVYREQNDVCILRLLESFLEAAPQLCLQLYIILLTGAVTPLAGISVVSSLISLAWALTAYADGLRLAFRDVYSRNWCSLFTHWMWHTCMTAARVMALVVFATVFKAWVFLAAGIHWIAMTIWISVGGTDFGEGTCERGLFQIVAGFIYIFCFLNLREGRSRHRMLAFYLVFLLENTVLVAVWFVYKDTSPIMDIVTPSVVFGCFLLGLACLLMYYRCLHPTGPIYLYTVKAVVHNGVLNNQRETVPSIFDLTAGTQLSVLGSDIVELSRDMDRTTLSLSRISNRSSGNFSQQNLQLAWEAGFAGRSSSSSNSSLDVMDFATSRNGTQNGTLTSSRSASSSRYLLQNSRMSSSRVFDQADRRDQISGLESTADYSRSRARKVYNVKDIHGFHENRFNGTYHSPLRGGDFVIEKPASLSPLDAAKLWEETTGRFRSPMIGRDEDTLSTLDASDLMDQTYNRLRSFSSWSSLGQPLPTHSAPVHAESRQSDHWHSRESSVSMRLEDLSQGRHRSAGSSGMNLLRESYLGSSVHDLVERGKHSQTESPVYGHISQATYRSPHIEPSPHVELSDRFNDAVVPLYQNQSYNSKRSPQYVSEEDSEEGESGVFTRDSSSDQKDHHYKDVSMIHRPEPVYAIPHATYPSFHQTQSAPGPVRHVPYTSQGVESRRQSVYANEDDLPEACRSVLPDTPWKLDYLNLEPLKTVLLKMQHIPEEKKTLVREYLKDLNDSIASSCHPSPMKLQEFTDSPAKFGRNIDLFNSRAWHAVKEIVDSAQPDSEDDHGQMSTNRSRRSLLSQDSAHSSNRPLSSGSDSGYQPFQRTYLDSDNKLKDTSPPALMRHSSKMSCIRGNSTTGAPVRGSPMPVKHRSKDRIDRRRSRELDTDHAKKSVSQTSLNGRYKKRLPNENKENSDSNVSKHSIGNTKPSNPDPIMPQADNICPTLASSYRQAISNTNKPLTLHNISDQSDLQMDNLYSGSDRSRRQSKGRQPFQSIQNTPAFSPVGGKQDGNSFSTFSSTPKVSSSLHSLALIDVYGSPVGDQVTPRSGSRPSRQSTERARSVDHLR